MEVTFRDITMATIDEALSGPRFVPWVGATRRRMGIISDIRRPKYQRKIANRNNVIVFYDFLSVSFYVCVCCVCAARTLLPQTHSTNACTYTVSTRNYFSFGTTTECSIVEQNWTEIFPDPFYPPLGGTYKIQPAGGQKETVEIFGQDSGFSMAQLLDNETNASLLKYDNVPK